MIRTSLFLLAAALLALADSSANLGPKRVMSGSASLKSGITIYFATYAIPGGRWGENYREGGIGGTGGEAIRRDMKDPATGLDFGYDLEFTGNASRGYQAIFRPLSGRSLPTPKLPPPQPVSDGDTIAFDIMVSPDGTQRITDYIQIFLKPPEPAAAAGSAEARDFTVDDGSITYDTSAMTFWINGQKQSDTAGFSGKRGSTFWISFSERKRYILSLVPHDGFSKFGVVSGNVAAFEDGGQQYEVRFMSPIAGSGKVWNLYVRMDSDHEPDAQLRPAIRCGTGRLEDLVAGR